MEVWWYPSCHAISVSSIWHEQQEEGLPQHSNFVAMRKCFHSWIDLCCCADTPVVRAVLEGHFGGQSIDGSESEEPQDLVPSLLTPPSEMQRSGGSFFLVWGNVAIWAVVAPPCKKAHSFVVLCEKKRQYCLSSRHTAISGAVWLWNSQCPCRSSNPSRSSITEILQPAGNGHW